MTLGASVGAVDPGILSVGELRGLWPVTSRAAMVSPPEQHPATPEFAATVHSYLSSVNLELQRSCAYRG